MILKPSALFVICVCLTGVPSEQLPPERGMIESTNGLDDETNGQVKRLTGHSFVRFGKRDTKYSDINDASYDVDENQDPTWKRGHRIIRFGKRAQAKHNFIRFGKRNGISDRINNEAMIYPSKRALDDGQRKKSGEHVTSRMIPHSQKSHSMMYFGKRSYQDLYPWIYPDDTNEDDYSPTGIILT